MMKFFSIVLWIILCMVIVDWCCYPEAEYKANELRTKALTPEILEQMWIDKWDGHLPTYGTVPSMFKDISKQ